MVLYFAYGSNMNEDHLQWWCNQHGLDEITIKSRTIAELKGFGLSFNYSSFCRSGGAANITRQKQSRVLGMLLEIDDDDYIKLRKKEAYPQQYGEMTVTVDANGQKVLAKTFKVTQEKECVSFIPPPKSYHEILVSAARKNKFPYHYQDFLQGTPYIED